MHRNRYGYIILSVLSILLLLQSACGSSSSEEPPKTNALKQQFHTQVEPSCSQQPALSKTVWDLTKDSTNGETQTLQMESDSALVCQLTAELSDAIKHQYNDPYLAEYLNIKTQGDTTIATRKPEYEGTTPLELQKVVEQEGSIRYIESKRYKKTWLYDIYTHIKVHFDPKGQYTSHELETFTEVLFIGQRFHARIKASAQYTNTDSIQAEPPTE